MANANQTPDQLSEFDRVSREFSFYAQLRMMAGAFWYSNVRNRVLLLTAALLTVILSTVYAQYRLNYWNTPFYNALEQRDLPAFLEQLQVFCIIAGTLLILNVIQAWLNQMTAVRMREGLTRDLIDQWMKPGRALKLASSGPIGINPDQRLHEDARNLAELTTTLAIGLVNATILLLSFVGVLWLLSADFSFEWNGRQIAIPGYMVWAALIYAGSASLLSKVVGRKLPGLNTQRYAKEAELRFALMHTNENLMAITLAKGEDSETRRIQEAVSAVLSVLGQLAWAATKLTWVSAGFGWMTTIAPILIAAPVYFSGTLSFGGLMMAVGAFNQVNTALRWYIDNFRPIADWTAALYRVSIFRRALCSLDDAEDVVDTVSIAVGQDGRLTIRDLALTPALSSSGAERGLRMAGETVIAAGERVMINGDPGANRHLLFMALAGLWRFGSGEIRLPPPQDMLFIPQKGYFPDATLREVLAYPHRVTAYGDSQLAQALTRVGLASLIDRLDQRERWERILDDEDQARLRLANAILLAPRWIVIDDAMDALEPAVQQEVTEILRQIPEVALIYIGRSEAFMTLEPRLIHLQPLK
ncbi:ABC transporter ATP-binding protein/permease [Rhizobium sp. SSA_523]|uniref:ABC transporter ATP-binding protein/permease n=1 Tax=Rhizobium sp. SSA_523 TaxID=2952477 RepID=UPI002090AB62|nr:ABC transporter ATP-binding protein/permease [Rhizobium sp. SSA_523]MCO5731684.1 ABC transporter ATP-binding protein/permease [Rhizobium sp. SSA_523]WKC22939.1 ABC transporter ATP-binding protein/permease [Rhizobium sp. SSA_523]